MGVQIEPGELGQPGNKQPLLVEGSATDEQHGNNGMEEGNKIEGVHPHARLVIVASSTWDLLVHHIIIQVLDTNRFSIRNNLIIEFLRTFNLDF